jgi:hypothetical protein
VKKIFVQNSFVSNDSNIRTLPLGLENLRWGMNGSKKLFQSHLDEDSKIRKVMIGPFSNTHPERPLITDYFRSNNGPWDVFDGYFKPTDLSKIARRYRYVACIRGNGVDTHRIWETLYRGNFPIVKLDGWSSSLVQFKLPIIFIEDWTSEFLKQALQIGNEMPCFSPRSLEPLWTSYWRKEIKS